MVIHTRLLFWVAGFTPLAGLVLVHPAHRGDLGLLAHEAVHQAQMRRHGWWRFVWRYLGSRQWRLHYELEAYAVSLQHGMGVQTAARCLARGYALRMDEAACCTELVRYVLSSIKVNKYVDK